MNKNSATRIVKKYANEHKVNYYRLKPIARGSKAQRHRGTEFLRRIISSLCLPVGRQAFATLPLCAAGPGLVFQGTSIERHLVNGITT